MTVVIVCDFCGKVIGAHTDWMEIHAVQHPYGRMVRVGDYHDLCWDKLSTAARLADEFLGNLENIPVATPQSIAARRRKHRRGPRD
jgi:hypothetical protein